MKANRDPRIDSYIEEAAEFARPILRHWRKLVHQACPEVEEAIKWNMPFFLHGGILCYMAAFKRHCRFGFWGPDMRKYLKKKGVESNAIGSLGRIASLKDLPSDKVLLRYIRQAVRFKETAQPARASSAKQGAKRLRVV